eukprot:TRINITY_DN2072_c1_g1_i1.p1 TRINITY_DN2072_c1_g1~~TRINITY_DN2072_c1_g1_i1.p1  ORF type:complete len:800 (+),score=260.80 TRINITY_DN2072_c1_g1_i1:71-2470(+)
MMRQNVSAAAAAAKGGGNAPPLLSQQQMIKLKEFFDEIDVDGSGSLSIVELHSLWQQMYPDTPPGELEGELQAMWTDIDRDGDNEVSFDELMIYLWGEAQAAAGTPSQRHYAQPLDLREWVWALMDQPTSLVYDHVGLQRASLAISLVIQATILVSVATIIVDSLPSMQRAGQDSASAGSGSHAVWSIEIVCVIVFSVELLLRTLSAPSTSEYLLSVWTMIDALSLLPFYLERVGSAGGTAVSGLLVLRVLRLARLFRVLRMLKLGRGSEGAHVITIALRNSRMAMVWLFLMMLMAMMLFGSMIHAVEKDQADFRMYRYPNSTVYQRLWVRSTNSTYSDAGEPIFFQSIPHGLWWALVTLTTVGYGEASPVTALGRCVGWVTVFAGLLVMAFPTTMLCNAFSEALAENAQQRMLERRRMEVNQRARVVALGGAARTCAVWVLSVTEQHMWRVGNTRLKTMEERVVEHRRQTVHRTLSQVLGGDSPPEEGLSPPMMPTWDAVNSRDPSLAPKRRSTMVLAFAQAASHSVSRRRSTRFGDGLFPRARTTLGADTSAPTRISKVSFADGSPVEQVETDEDEEDAGTPLVNTGAEPPPPDSAAEAEEPHSKAELVFSDAAVAQSTPEPEPEPEPEITAKQPVLLEPPTPRAVLAGTSSGPPSPPSPPTPPSPPSPPLSGELPQIAVAEVQRGRSALTCDGPEDPFGSVQQMSLGRLPRQSTAGSDLSSGRYGSAGCSIESIPAIHSTLLDAIRKAAAQCAEQEEADLDDAARRMDSVAESLSTLPVLQKEIQELRTLIGALVR